MSYGMGGGVFFFLRAFQRPEKQRIVVAAPPACGASCHLAAPGSASRLPANNWSFRSAITSCTADLAPARFASRPAARWGSLSLMLLRVSHWISRPAVNKLAPAAPGSGPDSLAGLPEVSLPLLLLRQRQRGVGIIQHTFGRQPSHVELPCFMWCIQQPAAQPATGELSVRQLTIIFC